MEKKTEAEEILLKSESEMSDIELLMAGILNESDKQKIENSINESLKEDASYVSPVPPAGSRQIKKSRQQKAPEAFDVAEIDEILNGKREKKPASDDLQPVKAARPRRTSEIRKADADRERKIKKEVKKKKKTRIVPIILIICAMIVVLGIVVNALMKDLNESRRAIETMSYESEAPQEEQEAYFVEIPEDTVFPEPETEEYLEKLAEAAENGETPDEKNAIVIMSSEPAGEKEYRIFVEDVSWTQAQERCISIGGKLVTISDEAELMQVITLAEQAGVDKVWVGCHRENGQLIWEGNENIDYYVWGAGEPSQYDSGDNVAEDYLLLWFFNRAWVYNDSRNDPVSDYPNMYSGKIAYVCEIN